MVREEGPLYVTRPTLPDFEVFTHALKGIWERRQLSNFGPEYHLFLSKLSELLGTQNIELVNNGTIGLFQILKVADFAPGEIITTAFTFPATAQMIAMSGHRPIFADIEPETLNLDPIHVARKITDKTRAILPVHVFGNPCRVEEFEELGRTHGIPVIYDAAHAMGVEYKNRSLVTYGDFSMVSFHATKIIHSFEGGLIFFRDSKLFQRIRNWSNFGIEEDGVARTVGFNSKMNEVCALMGRLMLEMLELQIQHRRKVTEYYRGRLSKWMGQNFLREVTSSVVEKKNYQYFPVLVDFPGLSDACLKLHSALEGSDIHARRYFYPLCTSITGFDSGDKLPIAENAANSILCLPLGSDLPLESAERVCVEIDKFFERLKK